jgi:integrase
LQNFLLNLTFSGLIPHTTKNDEGRTFPFAALPELAETLKEQWEYTKALQRETGHLIPHVFHRAGRPILNYRGAWEAACEEAKIVGRIPHDFRRTAVRNLERAGVPRSVAMKLTGHKTESVYRRYAIVSEADLSDGLKRLAMLHDRDARALEQSRTVTVLSQSLRACDEPAC